MTLIACLHPHQCRTLIADALITSPKSPRDELVFPTRLYISPNQIQDMKLKPVALRRKVIEINPNLVALWAGDLEHARRFADRAAAYFDGNVVEQDDVESFLRDHYSEHVPNFHAIVAPSDQAWFYKLGNVDRSSPVLLATILLPGKVSNSSSIWLIRQYRVRTPARWLT